MAQLVSNSGSQAILQSWPPKVLGLWAWATVPSNVFVNKVLLEHSYCFPSMRAESSSLAQRTYMAHKEEILLHGPWQKKFVTLLWTLRLNDCCCLLLQTEMMGHLKSLKHVIPATQEAETGELLKPGRQRLWWAEIAPLHSSLGNKVRLHLKNNNNNNNKIKNKNKRTKTKKI